VGGWGTADRDLQSAVRDCVEAVALLALPNEYVSGCQLDRFHGARQALQRGGREGVEDPEGAEQRDLDDGHVRRGVQRDQRSTAKEFDQRKDRRGA
jgi:hypothetical protein